MATDEDISQTYSDFAQDVTWKLYELQHRAAGARALLERSAKYDDADLEMLGVHYMISGLCKSIEELADRVSDSEFNFIVKAEVAHA